MKIALKSIMLCVAIATVFGAPVLAGGKKDTDRAASDKPSVRLVTDASGIDDKSFNAAAWRGILAYYGDTWANPKGRGNYYDVVTCPTQDAVLPALQQAADQGFDLIVAAGFTQADPITEVAKRYPQMKFAIIDVDWITEPNVINFVFAEHEGSYLVGQAAALKAQEDNIPNPRFGFIGGVPSATITKFEMGYIQGIKSVLPNAQIVDYYANDWAKPELAKTQAKNWFDSGVYMIYSAAGATGNGTIAQAKEYRIQGKNVWAIGVDSDQYEDGIYSGTDSAVYTSMLKKVESATQYALDAVAKNTFKAEVITLNMKSQGVDYSAANPALSTAIKNKLDDTKKAIVAGTVTVYPTYKETQAHGLAAAGLGALDD
jgi:basic membrane protein A